MNKFTPTAAQAAAIGTRNSAVLVSAGAGSGKTKVLTERLMGYICAPESTVDLDSFLIITFTKAAAGELRGRIMEELSAAQARDPGNRRLRRQSALCARTMIGTIHGFCSALLREHSQEAGLTPDFAVVDEARGEAMKAAALEQVLESRYEKSEPGFLLLADTVGAGRDDRRLRELVLELYEKMQCHARPEQWAQEQKALLQRRYDSIGESPWGEEYLRNARERVEYWSGEIDRLMAEVAGDAALKRRYLPSLSAGADTLREFDRCLALGWEQARACPPVKFGRTGPAKDGDMPDELLEARIDKRRGKCKDAVKALRDILDLDPEMLLRDIEHMAPALEALLDLTLDFDRAYAAEKNRLGLVDYGDLEHKAAKILIAPDGQPTELARSISRRYTEIMVDEYQDVSHVQDDIFRAISDGEKKLFMVGDVKQSIYRFRLADPRIFTEKYKKYADAASAAPGEARKIMLRENFRSRKEILDGANCVFSLCMSEQLGDIDYDEDAALKCAAAYEGDVPVPELILLPLRKDPEESLGHVAQEAAFVAGRIRALVESGETVTDRGQVRPMNYGDIAILLRAANADGAAYRRELGRLGIPVSSGQTGGFFASTEVSTAVALLELIDNPRQDIPLIAVLRSPALGFSADALAAIRTADKLGDFYDALKKRAADENDESCRAFLDRLQRLRQIAPDLSASELVWRVIEDFTLLPRFSAMADGEQRRARLLALAELAESFENSGYRGLHRFLLWLRQKQENNREPALGGGSGPAVQIMSVHKSKGLEFPVVFLCGMGKRFNQNDLSSAVLVHPDLGLGAKLTDTERRVEYSTLAREVIKERMKRETLSEELRLLYVAMTRPKERLYITAGVDSPEAAKTEARMQAAMPMHPLTLAAAQKPVQWLIQAALADGEEHLRMSVAETPEGGETAGREESPEVRADEETLRELRRRLGFRYAHGQAEELPSKVTATELKGRAEPDEDAQSINPFRSRPFRLPDFAKKDSPLTGAERGTATHLVLQYMDFAKAGGEDAVREEIERLRQERFLSDREAQAVNARAIVELFASALGQRMLHADRVRREFKFSLLCDGEAFFREAQGERVLLQGVVDCFIEEQGELTVIDYKTDAVRNEAETLERAGHYAGQLRAYAHALRRICKKPVRECVLYFLNTGMAVTVKI